MSNAQRPDGWHIERRGTGVWLEDWRSGRPHIRLHLTADQYGRLFAAMLQRSIDYIADDSPRWEGNTA